MHISLYDVCLFPIIKMSLNIDMHKCEYREQALLLVGVLFYTFLEQTNVNVYYYVEHQQ